MKKPIMKKAIIYALIFAMMFSIVGCGGGGTTPNDTPNDNPNDNPSETATININLPVIEPEGDGSLNEFSDEVKAKFNNAQGQVVKSPYADFKKVEGPWKVYFIQAFAGQAWQEGAIKNIEENVALYKEAGYISEYVFQNASGDVNTQIQQMQTAIEKGANLIILNPLSVSALDNVIKQAYDKGIVVILLHAYVTSPYAIGCVLNSYVYSAIMAQGIVEGLNGDGNVLMVNGFAGHPANAIQEQAADVIFSQNPGLKINKINGDWDNSVAKTKVIQYLTTHPEKIDAVYQQGDMWPGIKQAFDQAGRDLPMISFGQPSKAALAYNVQKLEEDPNWPIAGTCNPAPEVADACFRVGVLTLLGYGPKLNQIFEVDIKIDKNNIHDWNDPANTVETAGTAEPAPGIFFTADYLYQFFTHEPELPIPTVLHDNTL